MSTKKLFWLLLLVISLSPYSQANNVDLSDEDLTTFRNDLVIPRLLIYNSKEYINKILDFYNWDYNWLERLTDPTFYAIHVLFLVYLIYLVVIQKISFSEGSLRFLKSLIMGFAIALVIVTFSSIGKVALDIVKANRDYPTWVSNNINQFVIDPKAKDNLSDIPNLNNIDTSVTTNDIFCLNTIKDQYRILFLVISWLFVIITFVNLILMMGINVMITILLYVTPFVGILYIVGDDFAIIKKFWGLVWDTLIAKTVFFLIFGIISNFSFVTATGKINLEFAIYHVFISFVMLLCIINVRKVFRVDK